MFFSKPKIIIYITRQKIKAGRAILGKQPRLENVVAHDWDPKDLSKVLVEIKATLGKRARILFDDDLSYILKLSIPKSEKDERAYIAGKVAEKIPETLEDEDWDFKETGQTEDEKQVLVFAPVKGFLENLVSAAADVGLKIEAAEPVSMAKERYSDPMIGLAMKKDIKGKDDKVLNLILSEEISDSETEEEPSETSQGNIPKAENSKIRKLSSVAAGPWPARILKLFSDKKLILISVGVIAVFASIAVVFLIYKGMGSEEKLAPTVSQEKPSPPNPPVEDLEQSRKIEDLERSREETPETPQEKESSPSAELKPEDIKIQVLNGSGVGGVAAKVKGLLEESEFKNIEVGNAGSYAYTKTEISAKENVSKEILEDIKSALGGYEVSTTDPLTADNPFDVIVIVGKS